MVVGALLTFALTVGIPAAVKLYASDQVDGERIERLEERVDDLKKGQRKIRAMIRERIPKP
jgi:hypothetical protein